MSVALPAAPQDRPHTGEQFARIAGFGEIVVGAQFQADDPIDVFG